MLYLKTSVKNGIISLEGCFLNSSRYSEICREFEAKGVGIFNHDIQLDCEVEDVKYGDTTQE